MSNFHDGDAQAPDIRATPVRFTSSGNSLRLWGRQGGRQGGERNLIIGKRRKEEEKLTAMYASVPLKLEQRESTSIAPEIPKSQSLISPRLLIRMFEGFISVYPKQRKHPHSFHNKNRRRDQADR